jgi:hypothetical protein
VDRWVLPGGWGRTEQPDPGRAQRLRRGDVLVGGDGLVLLTPRCSSSLAASTQLSSLHDDFDAALLTPR